MTNWILINFSEDGFVTITFYNHFDVVGWSRSVWHLPCTVIVVYFACNLCFWKSFSRRMPLSKCGLYGFAEPKIHWGLAHKVQLLSSIAGISSILYYMVKKWSLYDAITQKSLYNYPIKSDSVLQMEFDIQNRPNLLITPSALPKS